MAGSSSLCLLLPLQQQALLWKAPIRKRVGWGVKRCFVSNRLSSLWSVKEHVMTCHLSTPEWAGKGLNAVWKTHCWDKCNWLLSPGHTNKTEDTSCAWKGCMMRLRRWRRHPRNRYTRATQRLLKYPLRHFWKIHGNVLKHRETNQVVKYCHGGEPPKDNGWNHLRNAKANTEMLSGNRSRLNGESAKGAGTNM